MHEGGESTGEGRESGGRRADGTSVPDRDRLAPPALPRIFGLMAKYTPAIPRHKTAIRRGGLSRRMKSALEDGLIVPPVTVFDYGCGHGQDMALLAAQGITCDGWDPAFQPGAPRHPADVVNLGFVLNVIEDVNDRAEALRQAWDLARRLLIVAAQVKEAGRWQLHSAFGDGVLTGRGTFQKFFSQGELKAFLEAELPAEAIPASLGIFYVFKDETLQQFLANRCRRRSATPRKPVSELRFEENRELLDFFMATIATLGRLPEPDEFPRASEVVAKLGSMKRAFALGEARDGSQRLGCDHAAVHRRPARLPGPWPVPSPAADNGVADRPPARYPGLLRQLHQGLPPGR